MTLVRERRFKAFPSRWGKGKVHRYLWSYENQVWYVACRSPYRDPHGIQCDSEAEVTCKKCLR